MQIMSQYLSSSFLLSCMESCITREFYVNEYMYLGLCDIHEDTKRNKKIIFYQFHNSMMVNVWT